MLLEALLELNRNKERLINEKLSNINNNTISKITKDGDTITILLGNGGEFSFKEASVVDLSNYYSKNEIDNKILGVNSSILDINTTIGNVESLLALI